MESTLIKGLQVMEALATSPQPRGITSLSNELGFTKSNVHRLLQTLIFKGYARRNEQDGTYELSSLVWEIGLKVRGRFTLDKLCRSAMASLASATGESVHLSVLDKLEVIYMDKIETDQAVRSYTSIGGRAPAWCVATGKAMLAANRCDARSFGPLTPYTDQSCTNPEELNREFEQIRSQGFAVNKGEWRSDVFGIASAISDATGEVVAAIGISGPRSRFRPRQVKPWAALVLDAARSISQSLGAARTHGAQG